MNKNRKLINAFLVSTMMLSGLASTASAADGVYAERISGKGRVETAINVSDKAYTGTADAVVVAGYNGQVDALTGTLLASAKDAPLLMVSDRDDHIASVKNQIAKLEAKTVYLLGGEGAVSAKVANALDVAGVTVERVAGKGRFATAVEVAKESGTTSKHAFITADGRNGTKLADALSAGPAAGMNQSPILLTSKDSVPAETKTALTDMGITSVTVVGGTAAVSEEVLTELRAHVGEATRLSGTGRIETAMEIAKKYFPTAENAVIANDGRSTGENYADALVGGYFGAKMSAPVLLTQPGALSTDVKNYLGSNSSFAYVLGGTGVVKEDVVTEANTAIKENKEADLEVESVSAINAKTLEVTFNKEVDPEEAEISIKKGTVTTNIANKEFAEDNKSVTLELSSKLTEGEYTVTVAGLTDDALTATYTAENEKVTDINFLSDKAIIDGSDVVVAYEVLNQYGEDITRTTSVNAVSSLGTVTVNATKSELKIPFNSTTDKVGDKFSLSLVNVESGVSETGTITISDASQVTDVEIKSLYHEADEVLDADEQNISDYKLIVEVKDQYGKKLDAAKANSDLLVRVSDTTVVNVDTYNPSNNTANFKDLKIDGKDVVVLELAGPIKAGKSTVNVISKYSGKTSAYEVTVNEGVKTNGITLSQPDLVVANEVVSIPFEATDMYGNALTKASVLNSGIKFTVSGTGSYAGTNGADALSFDVDKNGKTVLNLSVPSDAQGNATITALTDNQKFASLTVNVKEAATPVAITGIDKDVYTNVLESEDLTFKVEDLVAEDQYGRQMSGTKLKGYLGDTGSLTAGDLVLDVTGANASGGAITQPTNLRIGSATNTSFDVTGSARGTEGLKFALVEYVDGTDDKVVAGSEFEKSIRVVKQSDIVSYDMDDVPVMYDEAGAAKTENPAYNHEVEVFGLLSNGTKVFIPQQDAESNDLYQVTTNNTSLAYSSDELNVNAAASYSGNDTETSAKATVTINATGDTIVKDVVISKVAPKVEEVVYDIDANPTKISETADGFLIVESAGSIDNAQDHFGLLKITDQYGADATIVGTTGIITFKDTTATTVPGTVTFSNLDKGSSAAIADNGTFEAKFTGLAAGDTYTSTINLPNGKSTVANVIVKP